MFIIIVICFENFSFVINLLRYFVFGKICLLSYKYIKENLR